MSLNTAALCVFFFLLSSAMALNCAQYCPLVNSGSTYCFADGIVYPNICTQSCLNKDSHMLFICDISKPNDLYTCNARCLSAAKKDFSHIFDNVLCSCPKIYKPVCALDNNKSYFNICFLQCSGQKRYREGFCKEVEPFPAPSMKFGLVCDSNNNFYYNQDVAKVLTKGAEVSKEKCKFRVVDYAGLKLTTAPAVPAVEVVSGNLPEETIEVIKPAESIKSAPSIEVIQVNKEESKKISDVLVQPSEPMSKMENVGVIQPTATNKYIDTTPTPDNIQIQEVSASAEPVEQIETTKIVQPAELTITYETIQPVEQAEFVEVIHPQAPITPTKTAQPVEFEELTETAPIEKQVTYVEPIVPVVPVLATDRYEPIDLALLNTQNTADVTEEKNIPEETVTQESTQEQTSQHLSAPKLTTKTRRRMPNTFFIHRNAMKGLLHLGIDVPFYNTKVFRENQSDKNHKL